MFILSSRSRERLVGVHDDLRKVVERAIQLSEVDFTVTEGLRNAARQQQLVDQGKSWNLKSRHLDGMAVDLGALREGRVVYEWPLYFKIADAMRSASQELGVPLEWGGLWRRNLSDQEGDLKNLQTIYVREFRQAHGRSPHLDGPHFQLPTSSYPS